MTVKLLAKHHLELLILKGGYTGSSESTLDKMTHCRKSHLMAHLKNEYDFLEGSWNHKYFGSLAK